MASVLAHLTPELAAPVAFAFHTGWRIASEVLPMQWRQVDLKAGTVRLEAGTTKNRDARIVYMTAAVRTILEERDAERLRLKKQGKIMPLVFFRMRRDAWGRQEAAPGRILQAGLAAGLQCGRTPWQEAARPASHGGAQSRSGGRLAHGGDEDGGPPNREHLQPLQHHERGRPSRGREKARCSRRRASTAAAERPVVITPPEQKGRCPRAFSIFM